MLKPTAVAVEVSFGVKKHSSPVFAAITKLGLQRIKGAVGDAGVTVAVDTLFNAVHAEGGTALVRTRTCAALLVRESHRARNYCTIAVLIDAACVIVCMRE